MQIEVSEAGTDVDEVMRVVVKSAQRIISGADGALVATPDGDKLVVRAATGTSWPLLGVERCGISYLSGQCMSNRDPVLVEDLLSTPDVDETLFSETGARSAAMVPLPFRGKLVGLLALYSQHPRSFSYQDLIALQLIAGSLVTGFAAGSQIKAERRATVLNRRFTATFEQAAVGIAHVAVNGHFNLVNNRFCEIAGHSRESLLAGGFQAITHPDDLEADLAHVEDLLAGRAKTYSMEKRYVRANGETVWINLTVSLVRDANGRPDFFVAVIEDISARKSAQLDARRDPLTGLLNRRGLIDKLQLALSSRRKSELPLAIVYLDLDGFKAVNDQHGHGEGDKCLTLIASHLKTMLRDEDGLARMGGDEFVAVIPSADADTASFVVTRMLDSVRKVAERNGWEVSASAGLLIVQETEGVSPDSVIAAADELMYEAKASPVAESILGTFSPAVA